MDTKNKKEAKIFTMGQEFPCGPKSSCCGPIGQTTETVQELKKALEALDLEVEIFDIKQTKINLQSYPQVVKLFETFGPPAVPVIMINNEIASMGQADVTEIISAVKSKL